MLKRWKAVSVTAQLNVSSSPPFSFRLFSFVFYINLFLVSPVLHQSWDPSRVVLVGDSIIFSVQARELKLRVRMKIIFKILFCDFCYLHCQVQKFAPSLPENVLRSIDIWKFEFQEKVNNGLVLWWNLLFHLWWRTSVKVFEGRVIIGCACVAGRAVLCDRCLKKHNF